MFPLRVALAQVDLTVGAVEANAQRVRAETERAKALGAEVIVFPELTLSGYPPRDLLTLPGFVAHCERALAELAAPAEWSKGIAVIVGTPLSHRGPGHGLHNAAAVLQDGKVAVAHKLLLPTYDVFDEGRYFDPGEAPQMVEVSGVRVGLAICEDVWNDKSVPGRRLYPRDPLDELARDGAQLLLVPNASPYAIGKPRRREELLGRAARHHRVPIAYVNLVGGNDGLLFDGRSVFIDAGGQTVSRAPPWQEELALSPGKSDPVAGPPLAEPGSDAEADEILDGLALGVRDYLRKTGFSSALVGLSGGVDSALTAAIAVRALGPAAVRGVALPSRYNAEMSQEDARRLAENLGLRFEVMPIERLRSVFLEEVSPHFSSAGLRAGGPGSAGLRAGGPSNLSSARMLAEENLQSRIRGTALMALSNQSGEILLNTGNKSELAVGYCTLYGDMNGALAVIGDLLKTEVYRLARRLNHEREVIPARTLERPPTAELRDGQLDQDTLPPYDILDGILRLAIDERRGHHEIEARGFSPALVADVLRRLVQSEYKRRQAAPVLRVTERAFGEGWRFPIAQGFRG
jgi:NAD+ synthase (glutamine-hydrolysing)